MKCINDAALLEHFMKKERIYTFLARLNVEFDPVRVQVLGKEEIPSLNETIAIIRGEEGRRGVMMEPQPADGSALVTKASNPVAVKSDQQQLNAYSSGVGGNNGLPEGSRAGNKDSLWCTYCKKPRHSRERCWKPHGKPSNTKNNPGTAKSNQGGGPGNAHLTSTQSGGEGEFSQEQSKFNREEIEKLRYFLGTLKKPTGCAGTCSLALSGVGQGDEVINQNFVSKNVLHVPKLSTNLVSIHKLTKDLNCMVTFSSALRKFHNQSTGMMIGLARERKGLYLLEDSDGQNTTKDPILLPLLSEYSLSNKHSSWSSSFQYS